MLIPAVILFIMALILGIAAFNTACVACAAVLKIVFFALLLVAACALFGGGGGWRNA